MARVSAAALPLAEMDPVLHAPLDDLAESDEEREAVAAAKASRQMRSHSAVTQAIEGLRPAG